MSLSPFCSLPVEWQTCVVDVVPTSRAGEDSDLAALTATFQVRGPGTALLVATAGDELAAPPAVEAPDGAGRVQLERTSAPAVGAAVVAELADRSSRELWHEVAAAARGGIWAATVDVPDRRVQLRWTLLQRVFRGDGGGFEARLLAPLATMVARRRVPAPVAIALPWLPDLLVTIHGGEVEHPPGRQVSAGTERELAARRGIAVSWEHPDTLFRLRYAYSERV